MSDYDSVSNPDSEFKDIIMMEKQKAEITAQVIKSKGSVEMLLINLFFRFTSLTTFVGINV